MYSGPWIFTATNTIHDEAEQEEEGCHGKTDAIHCQVANNIITNVAFFLSTKKCRSLSLRRIQTVYSFNQNRDQISVAQLCHNGGYIPLGIMNMTKNPDHGLSRALKLICCQRFKFSMVFCMIMMLLMEVLGHAPSENFEKMGSS